MNPTTSRVNEPASGRRRVSPTYVFAVTTVAALLVLAVGLSRRNVSYVAKATVNNSQRDLTAAKPMPSTDELLEAVRTRYESTGAMATIAVEPSPESTAFEVSAVSSTFGGVTARLNEAASVWVKRRNEQTLALEETNLTVRRTATAQARAARDAAAQALREIDAQAPDSSTASPALVSIAPAANLGAGNATSATPLPNDAEAARRASLQGDIELAAAALTALQQRLTDAHPDVQHAQAKLADLQSQLAALPPPARRQPTLQADAPATAERDDSEPSRRSTPSPLTDHRADAAQHARQQAQSALETANLQLEGALKAEGIAARSYAALAANPPWVLEPAGPAIALPVGKTEAPWLIVLAASLALGTIAAVLACGLRPTVDTAEEAVAIFAAPVVGTIPAEGPLPPRIADPGVVGAQWIARCGLAMVMLIVAVAILAATSSGTTTGQLESDPLSIFAIPREWLAARLS